MARGEEHLLDLLGRHAQHLPGGSAGVAPVVRMTEGSRFVLIGEASHGTHEFYRVRAELTQRLIEERGFNAVIVEADWPDAHRVNRFIRGMNDDEAAEQSLRGFQRFPQWMWRNADVLDFVTWLREHNDALAQDRNKVGFYGMDLYSLSASIREVLALLDRVDHAAASRARYRYSCFEDFGEDPQAYGYAAAFDLDRSCEDEAVRVLLDLQRSRAEFQKRDGRETEDELFYAEQNARLVSNAEAYYRGMFGGKVNTWNVRDRHMVETIAQLDRHFAGWMEPLKAVVWAHNSHLGDAAATQMSESGEVNVGELMRQRYAGEVLNIGFTTYTGTVTAATHWDGLAERKRVRPALAGSYEEVFHRPGMPRLFLNLRDAIGELRQALGRRLERAIGVIYRPETERISHYFEATLAEQFDAVIHIDETSAVEPLEMAGKPASIEAETYPSGV